MYIYIYIYTHSVLTHIPLCVWVQVMPTSSGEGSIGSLTQWLGTLWRVTHGTSARTSSAADRRSDTERVEGAFYSFGPEENPSYSSSFMITRPSSQEHISSDSDLWCCYCNYSKNDDNNDHVLQ